MTRALVDLHCDLLLYLSMGPDRTLHDSQALCSLPQLQQGGVTHQVLALFGETKPHSVLLGEKQLSCFEEISSKGEGILFLPAIENGSVFALEQEPLDHALQRLETFLGRISPLYISLTWNGENRFGGGCGSPVGLKEDGKELLSYLSGRGIAIDFSHTSDTLAFGILNEIDKGGLDLPVLASHSNFRSVHGAERNLPDDLAKEIFRRGGLIGLVFYAKFLKEPAQLIEHIEKGLSLGGEKGLAFGADFFCDQDVVVDSGFHPELSDSSCYRHLIPSLTAHFGAPLMERIGGENALAFLKSTACFSR